jgi:hypothetical protein
MRIIIFTIFIFLSTFLLPAEASKCYGDADCHACHTCGYCANCNEPRQTHFCGVYYATHGEQPKLKTQSKKSVRQYVSRKNKRNA